MASFTLPGALAPRGAFFAQVLQALDAAFVARAARLDALADPHFLLRPEAVELAVGDALRRPAVPLFAFRNRRNSPGNEKLPRSSSTMRVATRSRKARSWVITIAEGVFRSRFSRTRIPSTSRWFVGSSSSSRSGSCAKASASAARFLSPPDMVAGRFRY